MMKWMSWRNGFKTKEVSDDWYDIEDDWPLIEASFFKQYGVRLRTIDDMPWNEFCSYLSGVMPDTPLGNVVQIRSETDKDVLKNFTKDQKKIRSDWINRKAKVIDKQSYDEVIEGFKKMFANLASGGDSVGK